MTNKLENSEEKVKNREQQLLTKDQEIMKLLQHFATLKRKFNLERVRFGLTLKETKHAAEKEINELKNEMKRAEEKFNDCRRRTMKAYCDSSCKHDDGWKKVLKKHALLVIPLKRFTTTI